MLYAERDDRISIFFHIYIFKVLVNTNHVSNHVGCDIALLVNKKIEQRCDSVYPVVHLASVYRTACESPMHESYGKYDGTGAPDICRMVGSNRVYNP